MAGGTFDKSVGKIRPGTYINFESANQQLLGTSDRGTITPTVILLVTSKYKSAGKEKIYSAFDALIKMKESEKLFYTAQTFNGSKRLLLKDIMYVQVHDHYADFYLCNDKIICERKKIKALIEDSLFDTFILINRNTMINYKFIDELSENIKLSNGEEFVYSKRRRNEIYNKFLYLRRNQF